MLNIILMLLLYHSLLIKSGSTILYEPTGINLTEVVKWVNKLLQYYDKSVNNKLLIYHSSKNIMNDYISNNISIIIFNDIDVNTTESFPLLIILEDKIEDLEGILKVYYNTFSYTQQIPVFIVTSDTSINKTKIFEGCKNLDIIRVILYVLYDAKWYIADPQNLEVQEKTNDYKILKQLHKNYLSCSKNCQIKTCVFDYRPSFMIFYDSKEPNRTTGVDKYLMNTIMQHLNATNEIIKMPKSGTEFIKGRQNLQEKVCDIIFVSLYVIPDFPGVVDLYPMDKDGLCFLVPKSKPRSNVLNLIRPFQMHVWMYLLLACICLAIFWCYFFYLHKNQDKEKYLNLLDFYGILLNLNLHVEFQSLVTSSKIFICSLTIYTFYVTFAYQGLLVSFLMNPTYHKDMDTLEDIKASGLKIYGLDSMIDNWKKTDEAKMFSEEIKDILVGRPNYKELIKRRRSNDISVGYIGRRRIFKFFLDFKIHNPNGKPVFHLMKECFQRTFCSYVARKDFPHLQRFQELIYRSLSAGLLKWWDLKSKFEFNDVTTANHVAQKLEDSSEALTMSHLLGIFYCWIIGVVLSFITFLSELVVYRMKNIYHKPKYEFIL